MSESDKISGGPHMTDMEQVMAKALEGQFWGWSENGYQGRVRNLNVKLPLPASKKRGRPDPMQKLPEINSLTGGITCDAIVRAVCVASGVSLDSLQGQRRFAMYAVARQAAMWLAHEMTHLSTTQIGKAVGGRDHSTVLHGIRCVNKNPQRYEAIINEARRLLDESGLRQAA